MDRQPSSAHEYLVAVVLALLAATGVPFYLISLQPDEFAHFDFRLLTVVSLALAFGLALFLCTALRLLLGWFRQPARFTLRFCLFWVVLTGLLFPAVGSTSLVDPAKLDVNGLNLVIAGTIAIGFARWAMVPRIQLIPYTFVTLLVMAAMFAAVIPMYRLFATPDQKAAMRRNALALSPHANLLVVSLDGIPGPLASEILRADSALRRAYKDFWAFENVIAMAPSTEESMLGELYGNRDFRAIASKQNELFKHLDLSALPFNGPVSPETIKFTFGFYNRFNTNLATRLDTGDLSGWNEIDALVEIAMYFEYVLARLATARAVRLLRKLSVTEIALRPLASMHPDAFALRLFHHKGPLWDLKHIKHIRDFESFIDRLQVGKARAYVGYLHFSHTHFPVDFDSQCRYRGDDAAWVAQMQNRAGLLAETTCALRQAARLIAKLQSLGVYDDTFIVIKSDHGQPAAFYDTPPADYRINGHPLWGFDRYRPLLLIKDRRRRADGPVFAGDLVTLGDLARTICMHWYVDCSRCGERSGLDLLGKRNPDEAPFIYLNVVRDDTSDYRFDTHKTVRLERSRDKQDFLAQLRSVSGVRLSRSGKRVSW